jgi:pimeloyl-ACP methyl ester carboxylesterase
MIRRYEVTGAAGIKLVAWEYAVRPGAAGDGAPAAEPKRGTGREPERDAPRETPRQSGPGAEGPADPRPGMLLTHGLLGRASRWAATARRLSPRYRAVALDQLGHGRSGKPEGPYDPDAYAADVIAAVEQLGLAPVTLIGHSMGALTAWQVAGGRPDLVAAVVICDMRASAVGEAGQREWADWLGTWPAPFATLGDVRRWFAADDPWAGRHDPVRGAFFAEVMEETHDGWRPQYSARHLLSSREPWIRDAHWGELSRVACPALVVRGLDGELGRAEAQEMVRVLPRGRYAEIADAGHLVPWDQPDAWYETVERFLREALAERQDSASGAASGRRPGA